MFDDNFKSRLQTKIRKRREEMAADFIEADDTNLHEIGKSRGMLKMANEVLAMFGEVEQEIYDEQNKSRMG